MKGQSMKRYLEYWYQKYRDLKLAEKMIIVYVLMLGICFLISVAALQVSFNIYDGKLYEKSLQELDVRRSHDVNVVGIKVDEDVEVNPDPLKPLEAGMVLILVGSNDALEQI